MGDPEQAGDAVKATPAPVGDIYAAAMHVPSTLLANMASVGNDGLLYINGGGWEHFTVVGPGPKTVQGYLAGLFDFEGDSETQRVVQLDVVDQDGVGLGALATLMVAATSRLMPFAIGFSIVLPPAATKFTVRLSDDAGVFSSTDCDIVRA